MYVRRVVLRKGYVSMHPRTFVGKGGSGSKAFVQMTLTKH